MVRCSNKTQRTLDDLALEVIVPDGYRLAVMEIPRKVEGRSVVQIPTRVLLQINSLSPDEGTSLRVFLSVPVERYPLPANDTLRMALHFPESAGQNQGILAQRFFGWSETGVQPGVEIANGTNLDCARSKGWRLFLT